MLILLALLWSLALDSQSHAFVITGAGRFAQAADTASIVREGDTVRMRVLQVADKDFHVGDVAYWGGWSWWRFDCAARTADRLDFASVREGGIEGPAMTENQPAYSIVSGGDADELAAVACAAEPPASQAVTLEDAVRLGRAAIGD
ncbi:MAG: hypothetical protein ACT6RD_13200 [Brevundimonas sp.]|uniref:hypothetical protein n=1 Tax=Brevundimonas sp. TaxID=1871086 RepID=UPI0040342978